MDTIAPEFQPAVDDPTLPPFEPVTPIVPSEAIRLGRLMYPYAVRRLYQMGDAACTLGAMIAGYGGDEEANKALLKLRVPKYVWDKIHSIPYIVDKQFPTKTPDEIEALLIRSLKAMGY